MKITTISAFAVTAALATTLSLGACSGNDDDDDNGGGTNVEPFTIQKIGLFGNSQEATAVKVDQQDDADGLDDGEWYVDYTLDGRATGVSQPEDTGAEQTLTFNIKGTQVSDDTVYRQRVRVTISARE